MRRHTPVKAAKSTPMYGASSRCGAITGTWASAAATAASTSPVRAAVVESLMGFLPVTAAFAARADPVRSRETLENKEIRDLFGDGGRRCGHEDDRGQA